jgi:mono/diheme cytochrome c family protein
MGDVASEDRTPVPPPPEVQGPDTTDLASTTDAPPPDASALEASDGPASPLSTADLVAGDALYRGAGRCAGCHGSAGEGVARLGPSLVDGSWLHGSSRAAIRRVTAEGAAPPLGGYAVAMPAYGAQLGPEQLTQLATYVWALSHPEAVRADSTAPRPTVPMGTPAAPATPPPRPTVPTP